MNIQASSPDAAREIDTPYDITPEQLPQFEQQGFIKLSNVLSPQTIAYFKDALDPLMHHRAQELPPLAERDIYGQAFVAYDNLWVRDKTGKIKQLVFSRRLSMIAAALLRAQGVGLWHDQGLYKPPGGIGTPEHRDWFYWPMKAGKAATIWVALNDIPAERGSLKMRVGSNHIKLKHEEDCEISTLKATNISAGTGGSRICRSSSLTTRWATSAFMMRWYCTARTPTKPTARVRRSRSFITIPMRPLPHRAEKTTKACLIR
jgi:Phytanoyl-CoA dioxygenase (PhyH)